MLIFHERLQEIVEFRFEQGLQTAEYEIATGRGVHEKTKVEGCNELGQCVALNPTVYGGQSDEPMAIGVHQAEQ